jgi:hypothetical protein
VRSREWQNSHFKLRTALNEILDLSNSQEMAAHLVALRNLFSQQVDKAFASMKKTENDLTEATKREDYAYTLKQSLDLVKLKARGQAAKVITDELTSLLSSSGKSNIEPAQNAGFGAFRLVAGGDAVSDEPQFTSEAKVNRQVAPRDSKVIPFRRNRLS